MNGGGGGIRTHDTLFTYTGFRDRRLQPLGHPSGLSGTKLASAASEFNRRLRRAAPSIRLGAVLWTGLVVLLILWLLALLLGAGRWIHVLPVLMACLLAYRLFVPRRRRW
jgi:hypothetical protein